MVRTRHRPGTNTQVVMKQGRDGDPVVVRWTACSSEDNQEPWNIKRHEELTKSRTKNLSRRGTGTGHTPRNNHNDLTTWEGNYWAYKGNWDWWPLETLINTTSNHTHTITFTQTHQHETADSWTVTVPLSLGTPPGVPRQPYLSIVIIDKGVIQNVSSRYPTSLLRTVTLPVHQVLKSASPPSRVQNAMYQISGFPIYESRRWGNRGWRING